MKKKKYWILVAVVTCVFVSMGVFGISDGEKFQLKCYGTSTLKGLRGVSVDVSCKGDKSFQVTEDAIQTKVELELRRAGIKVFSTLDINVGHLIVHCNLCKAPEILPVYYGNLSVSLHQRVRMERNPKIVSHAKTWPLWPSSNIFFAGTEVVEQYVDNMLVKEINEFINDYLAANPRR